MHRLQRSHRCSKHVPSAWKNDSLAGDFAGYQDAVGGMPDVIAEAVSGHYESLNAKTNDLQFELDARGSVVATVQSDLHNNFQCK